MSEKPPKKGENWRYWSSYFRSTFGRIYLFVLAGLRSYFRSTLGRAQLFVLAVLMWFYLYVLLFGPPYVALSPPEATASSTPVFISNATVTASETASPTPTLALIGSPSAIPPSATPSVPPSATPAFFPTGIITTPTANTPDVVRAPSSTVSSAPSTTPLATPTSSPPPTDTSVAALLPPPPPIETRIETEGVTQMEVGRSSVVSVRVLNVPINLPPSTPERPGAIVVGQPAPILGTPGPAPRIFGDDYDAFVTARLTGSGFSIDPEEQETEYRLLEKSVVSWDWSVTPNQPGLRDLIVTVDIEYRHRNGFPPIAYRLARQRLDVAVAPILFEPGPPAQLVTLGVLVCGAAAGHLFTRWLNRRYPEQPNQEGSRKKR